MLRPVQFARHSYLDASRPISSQRLVNLYLSEKPQDAKNSSALVGTPGLDLWTTVGAGPVRGIIGLGQLLYVVSGGGLYRIDRFGSATLAGEVSGLRLCSMAQDGFRVVIVSDSDIYWASETGFGQLPVSNCVGVAVHDGYFLFAERGTQKFFISDITAPITDGSGNVLPPQFNPLEFTLVNAYPDLNKAIVNSNRETWIFGEKSAQIYYDSGALDFPFSRMSGGVLQRGCLSTRSVAEYQGTIFWLGDDKRVYMAQGSAPFVISTEAIDTQIEKFVAPADAVGFTYAQRGHVFYVLSFNETTFVYDAVTSMWHERQSNGMERWRVNTFCDFFDRLLVGDISTNHIHELNLSNYTDEGQGIVRTATAPPFFAGGQWAFMSAFYIDMEVGVGLITGQGSDPTVMLDWSDDGGFTYKNEVWRTAGRIGAFTHRVEWRRLGRFQQRTMRLRISDPVKCSIIQAFADIEVGEP